VLDIACGTTRPGGKSAGYMMRAVNTALETTAEVLPNVGAGLDTDAGATFVQDRLRLLGCPPQTASSPTNSARSWR